MTYRIFKRSRRSCWFEVFFTFDYYQDIDNLHSCANVFYGFINLVQIIWNGTNFKNKTEFKWQW